MEHKHEMLKQYLGRAGGMGGHWVLGGGQTLPWHLRETKKAQIGFEVSPVVPTKQLCY